MKDTLSEEAVGKQASDWRPPYYLTLNAALKFSKFSNEEIEKRTRLSIGENYSGSQERGRYINGLNSAAAKVRLAHVYSSLNLGKKCALSDTTVSLDLAEKYSSQVKVLLSIVALETHLRMQNLRLSDMYEAGVMHSSPQTAIISCVLRKSLLEGAAGRRAGMKLQDAMGDWRLKARLGRFFGIESSGTEKRPTSKKDKEFLARLERTNPDHQVLAVASAIRNCFAHGKSGADIALNAEGADKLKSYILSLIEADSIRLAKVLRNEPAA